MNTLVYRINYIVPVIRCKFAPAVCLILFLLFFFIRRFPSASQPIALSVLRRLTRLIHSASRRDCLALRNTVARTLTKNNSQDCFYPATQCRSLGTIIATPFFLIFSRKENTLVSLMHFLYDSNRHVLFESRFYNVKEQIPQHFHGNAII